MISIQYSGTGALKTDYTRTGKRTKMGMLKDGVNSLTRYYKNNFTDGYRQDAIDLFVGCYSVQDGEGCLYPCPLRIDRGWKYVTVSIHTYFYYKDSILKILFLILSFTI